MIIKRITDSYGEVTALCREGEYLWIGYLSSGISKLRKVSNFDPTLIYYDLTLPTSYNVTKINKINTTSTDEYIYLAIDSTSHIGMRYHKGSPLSSYMGYTKPIAVTENSIDVVILLGYVYFLTPGIPTEKAKLLKYYYAYSTIDNSVDIEKDGDEIHNAKAMTIDENNNIWVVTYTDPAKLIKITNALVVSLIKYLG